MRVATWEAIGTVEVRNLDDPLPGPNDVLLEVGACGICGSDVHAYVEGAWIAPGSALGHEYSGTVAYVGDNVSGVTVGDRVAVIPAYPCGECPRCREGRLNLCGAMRGRGAGLADRVLLSQPAVGRQLFVLPDSVSLEEAALLEPLSVATRTVAVAAPDYTEPILVFGLGSIGQCLVQVLLARGATDVIGVDTSKVRRDAAAAAGVQEVIDPVAMDVVEHLLDSRGRTVSPYQTGGAIGTVFECSGAVQVLPGALRLLRAGGVLAVVALASRDAQVNINDIVQKEIRVHGSFAYTPDDTTAAFALMSSGKIHLKPLISHRFSLGDVGAAFEAQRRTAESVKVVVSP